MAKVVFARHASRTAIATVAMRPPSSARIATPVFRNLPRSAGRWSKRVHKIFGEWQLASICGRDELGRDVLSRVFWGARISLIVGLVAATVSLVIGVTYGSIAGYVGGRVDNAMMRFVDVLYSVPFIFIVIFLLTILGQEDVKAWLTRHGISRLTIFYLVVGAIYWLTMARVVRGQVISLKTEPFVEAARAMGAARPESSPGTSFRTSSAS